MKFLFIIILLFGCQNVNSFFVQASEDDLQRSLDPSECPGSCSSSIFSCKSSGGRIVGFCSNGKVCCGSGSRGFGMGSSQPSAVTCGASVMAHKMVSFKSPNYPAFSGGSLICEFTLQLNPATVGIRVDFKDLHLPSVPTNPINFIESPHSVCDSDYIMLRGFSGWAPDFRCGNLTGYSLMIERESDQPTLSTLLIMSSPNYRWNIKYTEIYFNEVESIDYALRNSGGNNFQEKKQWIVYPPNGGASLSFSPINYPALPPSMLVPPSWQILYPLMHRSAITLGSEVGYLNSTGTGIANRTTLKIGEGYEDIEENVAPSFSSEGQSEKSSNEEKTNTDNDHFSRIVGGVDAKPNSVPWQVSLQLVAKTETDFCGGAVRNMSSHFCGGTIIGERTILSASHCFFSASRNSHPLIPTREVKVVVGEHDFCADNEVTSTREYSIERVIMHFNYLASDVLNDMAIIQLTKPIKFDKNVHPIALPTEQTKFQGLKPLLSGWGSKGVEENSTYPSILQQTTNIHIFTDQECEFFQREFLEYVVPDFRLSGKYRAAFTHGICTKPLDNLTEAGFGDSGGPLAGISQNGAPPVLMGVVSHMRPHVDPSDKKEFHLNYFGKVVAYRKWILMGMVER